MVCTTTCFISIIFLIANIYLMITTDCKKDNYNLDKLLTNTQKNIKKKIVEERKSIYFNGYAIGLFLSLIIIFCYNNFIIIPSKKNISIISLVCIVGTITFTTNYFYYILTPKTTYMIEHLNTKQQITEWLKVYRIMQIKYHSGLIIGILAIMVFAYANRC